VHFHLNKKLIANVPSLAYVEIMKVANERHQNVRVELGIISVLFGCIVARDVRMLFHKFTAHFVSSPLTCIQDRIPKDYTVAKSAL
jgi:hypothetical protein